MLSVTYDQRFLLVPQDGIVHVNATRVSVPKATWCLKGHGSLYLPVKNINLVHN